MRREEIIDICQISKQRWLIHEASGKLPLPNKEEYTAEEALTLIKYWRYARQTKRWSTDYTKRGLAKFLGIADATLHHQIEKGNIPQPDKHVGQRHFYSHELANRIKETYIKDERPWTRAKAEGFYTLTEAARMLGVSRKTLLSYRKANHEFKERMYYSKRDIRELKRTHPIFEKQNENPTA